MILARWQIDARFGHRDAALTLMRRWWSEIAPQLGWASEQVRIASGSLGVAESRLEVEVQLANLAELNSAWQRLANARGQTDWAQEISAHVVSGSARWHVYKVEQVSG